MVMMTRKEIFRSRFGKDEAKKWYSGRSLKSFFSTNYRFTRKIVHVVLERSGVCTWFSKIKILCQYARIHLFESSLYRCCSLLLQNTSIIETVINVEVIYYRVVDSVDSDYQKTRESQETQNPVYHFSLPRFQLVASSKELQKKDELPF